MEDVATKRERHLMSGRGEMWQAEQSAGLELRTLDWNPCSTVIRHGRHCACDTKGRSWVSGGKPRGQSVQKEQLRRANFRSYSSRALATLSSSLLHIKLCGRRDAPEEVPSRTPLKNGQATLKILLGNSNNVQHCFSTQVMSIRRAQA